MGFESKSHNKKVLKIYQTYIEFKKRAPGEKKKLLALQWLVT
jgi:hypothetical protein